jgi:hypothetical protein
MAIKFSAKDQPAASAGTAKPAAPAAPKSDVAAEAATDLFKSPADVAPRKGRKKK